MKLVLFILPLVFSCSTLDKSKVGYKVRFQENINSRSCEEAQKTIPLERNEKQVLRFTKSATGFIFSVGVLPFSSMLDLVLMTRCRYGCYTSSDIKIMEELFPVSSFIYEETKGARCPDNSYYVNKLIAVGLCYESRIDLESLKKAYELMSYLHEEGSKSFTCMKRNDLEVVGIHRNRILRKINPRKK